MDTEPEIVYGFSQVTAKTDYVVSQTGYVYARRLNRAGRVTAKNPLWKIVKNTDSMFVYCRERVGYVERPKESRRTARDHYGDF